MGFHDKGALAEIDFIMEYASSLEGGLGEYAKYMSLQNVALHDVKSCDDYLNSVIEKSNCALESLIYSHMNKHNGTPRVKDHLKLPTYAPLVKETSHEGIQRRL